MQLVYSAKNTKSLGTLSFGGNLNYFPLLSNLLPDTAPLRNIFCMQQIESELF